MGKIIDLSDYEGTNVIKSFITPDIQKANAANAIKKIIEEKFEKGIIDEKLKIGALKQLDDIVKAEGSRGGHIIGHTKSGKPIYDGKMASSKHYQDFSEQDHYDAHEAKKKHWKDNDKDKDISHHAKKQAEMNSHAFEAIKKARASKDIKKGVDNNDLQKGGEGSKGGHIIGHTRSGKPIYDTHGHEGHANFSAYDHRDAVEHHRVKAQENYFMGRYDKQNHHLDESSKHHVEMLSRDVDNFNSLYNNPKISVLTISSKNPLSSQLNKLTGDSYNATDFYGNAGLGQILTHAKTGKQFTTVREYEAPLIEKYKKLYGKK